MWVLALNLTAIIVVYKLMISADNLFTILLGIVCLYANIVCALDGIKVYFKEVK